MGSFSQFADKHNLRSVFSPFARIDGAMYTKYPRFTPKTQMEHLISLKAALYRDTLKGGYIAHGDIDFANGGMKEMVVDMSAVKVDGNVNLTGNKLETLHWAPREFTSLKTDFGTFKSWDEVPDVLKQPTANQLKQEADARERARGKTLMGWIGKQLRSVS